MELRQILLALLLFLCIIILSCALFGGIENHNDNTDNNDGGENSCASARHRDRRRNVAVAIRSNTAGGSNTAPATLHRNTQAAAVQDALDVASSDGTRSIMELVTSVDVLRFLQGRNRSRRNDGEKYEEKHQNTIFRKADVCDIRRNPANMWDLLSSRNRCVPHNSKP